MDWQPQPKVPKPQWGKAGCETEPRKASPLKLLLTQAVLCPPQDGTPGEDQDTPREQGTDDPIELFIVMEMECASASADPILLRCEWSTFVTPLQQKFIDALDAFCSTHSISLCSRVLHGNAD